MPYALAIIPLLLLSKPKPIEPSELKATVEKLASWRTRNTNTPELLEAANWIADQYRQIAGAQVELMKYSIKKGSRIPEDREVVEVVAKFPATEAGGGGPIMMGGHFDSINMQPQADVYSSRAPGADDDGSAIAATLAVAKRLAATPHSHPYMFVAFSGEEQGLLGSAALAARTSEEKTPLEAVLNNDIIGSSSNLAGQADAHHVRLFSEESPKNESRELARYIEWLQRTSGSGDFHVKLVFRSDRFGRGGDHSSFNLQGFTAVRFVEMHEEYSRQHTDQDLPAAIDFNYLSRVAQVNLLTLEHLANAGPSPLRVRVDRHQSHNTKISWIATPGTHYRLYWRDTTEPIWSHSQELGQTNVIDLKMVGKDENTFGIGADGGIPVVAG